MADEKPNSDQRREGDEGEAGRAQRREQALPENSRPTRQGNKRSTDGTPNGQKV